MSRLIDRLSGDPEAERRNADAAARLDALSPREREIAAAVARGLTNAAIAAELFLSLATVKGRVSALLTKLALDNRVQVALVVQGARRA